MSKALIKALKSARYEDAMNILLEKEYDITATDRHGLTAMHLAAAKGYASMIVLLAKLGFGINALSSNGRTPLHFAAHKQRADATKQLLALKAKVRIKDHQGITALYLAVENNTSAAIAITKALLEAGAKPNSADERDQTPLHNAVLADSYSQVRLLIQNDANSELTDDENNPPVSYAEDNLFTRIQHFLEKDYIDSEASDTDSEDILDYIFLQSANIEPSNTSTKKSNGIFSANLNGEELSFEEQWITPNGDCAFIGLGTDRLSLTEELRSHPTRPIREMLWQEVAEAILTGVYKPQGSQSILTEFYAHPENHPEPLKTFCCRKSIFRGYLTLLANTDTNLWLGYQAAKAYATLKNIQLYIWTQSNNRELTLAAQNKKIEPSQEIHLLHSGNYTHFNLLVKSEPLDETIELLENKISRLSLETEHKRSHASSSSSTATTSSEDSFAIPHFRGVHFYKEYFNRSQRKQSITVHREQDQGSLPRTGLYSSATFEVAKVPLGLPKKATQTRLRNLDEKLSAANKTVLHAMNNLKKSKNVEPCLGRGKSSRKKYSTRYTEFVQRYVNSYHTLMEDMSLAPKKKIDGRTGKTGTTKWNTLKKLGFTKLPLVSTSESIYWGLEYASALLNWDKSGTHLPREGAVTVQSPTYSHDGHARFPYLGILYVTLHSHADLTDEISTRILDLFAEDEIDTKCSSPGGHLKGGYLKARERVFIGGIESDCVKLSLVIRVPSFYHEYRPFIQEKYGMDEGTYNDFKRNLSEYGHPNRYTGAMRNPLKFNHTQQSIIQFVISNKEALIERQIKEIAKKANMSYGYLGLDNTKVESEMPDLKEFVAKKTRKKI